MIRWFLFFWGIKLSNIDFTELPKAVSVLKLLANPERLKIVCVLAERSLNVGEIEMLTHITQPTLSQQLGILRKKGVLSTDKRGKFVYYQLADPKLVQLIGCLHELYCDSRA